jgi:hypothetical protein
LTASIIDRLEPGQIAGIFGRPSSLVSISALSRLAPKARAALASLTVLGVAFGLMIYEGALTAKVGLPSPWSLLLTKPKHAVQLVSYVLLQDPVGAVVLVLALASPIFCAAQVGYISIFNSMNEGNLSYRASNLDADAINAATAKANCRYAIIGNRITSAGLLVVSAAESLLLDVMLRRHGLLQSWNGSTSPAGIWRQRVYDGWWANPDHYPVLAVVLWVVGIYYFYFLQKQLLMGNVFARYVRSIMKYNFGVTPNVRFNTDGWWGLRPLRYFMQWTYLSMLCDFTITLGVFMVWFPFTAWTILIELSVMVINFTVVIYPSMLAQGGAMQEKKLYANYLMNSNRPRAEREAAIDAIWARPNLPFHIRSTLTALTIYLLIPIVLALVSSLLPR